MATYYGEVLPLVSRAVDDDEDHDVPIDDIELVVTEEAKKCVEEKDLLVFGTGLASCIFLEAYVLGLTENAHSLPILIIKRRQSEDQQELPLNGLDYRKRKDILARVYTSIFNPKVVVCVCPERVSEAHSALIPNLLFGCSLLASVKEVLALTSASITEFKHSNSIDNAFAPILRYLSTSTLTKDKVPTGINQRLEQPNVLSGVTAGALSECEVRGLPALACVCYTDSDDSLAVRAFHPLLQCWPLQSITRLNERAEQCIDKLVLQRLQHHGNLYI